jgi:hypothetical protein
VLLVALCGFELRLLAFTLATARCGLSFSRRSLFLLLLHWALLFLRLRWSSPWRRLRRAWRWLRTSYWTRISPSTRLLLLLRSYFASWLRLRTLWRRYTLALWSHRSCSTLSLWRNWCSLYTLLLPFLLSLRLLHALYFTW